MQERIKQIPTKFVEFWNKYTGVQKTIIISVICVVLLAIGLTTYFVSRPTWVKFNEFNNLNDANAMAKALDDANVSHKSSKDGLTLYVHDDDMTDALYTMSDNNLVDTGYTWDSAFNNSMSTTESEKDQKRILALQSDIQKSMVKYSFIDDADVFIDVPESTYSILDEEGKTSITARITVSLIRRQHRRLHTGLQMPLERMLRMLLSTIPMEHAGIMVRRPVALEQP